jgi:hypothetical protein
LLAVKAKVRESIMTDAATEVLRRRRFELLHTFGSSRDERDRIGEPPTLIVSHFEARGVKPRVVSFQSRLNSA